MSICELESRKHPSCDLEPTCHVLFAGFEPSQIIHVIIREHRIHRHLCNIHKGKINIAWALTRCTYVKMAVRSGSKPWPPRAGKRWCMYRQLFAGKKWITRKMYEMRFHRSVSISFQVIACTPPYGVPSKLLPVLWRQYWAALQAVARCPEEAQVYLIWMGENDLRSKRDKMSAPKSVADRESHGQIDRWPCDSLLISAYTSIMPFSNSVNPTHLNVETRSYYTTFIHALDTMWHWTHWSAAGLVVAARLFEVMALSMYNRAFSGLQ